MSLVTDACNAIELESVDAYRRETLALDDVSLEVPRGAITAVMGPNGAGKSTLFGLISGRFRAAAGRVAVDGSVAEVLQSASVDKGMPLTVEDVVRQGRYRERGLFRRFTKQDRDITEEALGLVDMAEHRRTPIYELSGGQRQRVLVAQGIAQRSPILLLDEPTAGVDLPTQQDLRGVLRDIADAGTTVMFSTHSVSDATESDVMVALACRCVCCAPTSEALRDPNVVELISAPKKRRD